MEFIYDGTLLSHRPAAVHGESERHFNRLVGKVNNKEVKKRKIK
jgi:hypothetical protein